MVLLYTVLKLLNCSMLLYLYCCTVAVLLICRFSRFLLSCRQTLVEQRGDCVAVAWSRALVGFRSECSYQGMTKENVNKL